MAETYFGKVCLKHPELNGERYTSSRKCLECRKEIKRKYREANPEKRRESQKKYRQTPEGRLVRRVDNAKRRARKKEVEVPLTKEEQRRIKLIYELAKLNGKEVDHIVPLSKGGKHHPGNLQLLDPKVNRRKSDKLIHPLFLWQLE